MIWTDWWCRQRPCQLFQTVLSPPTSLQVTSEAPWDSSHADPQNATGHLAAFLPAAPTLSVYANQRTDLPMPAPAQHPSFHKGAKVPKRPSVSRAGAVVCNLEDRSEKPSATPPCAHFSILLKHKHWRSRTILHIYNGHHTEQSAIPGAGPRHCCTGGNLSPLTHIISENITNVSRSEAFHI